MELSIKDRFILLSILPEKNNFLDFNLKSGIAKKISIGEKEQQELEIRELKDEGRITWDVEKDLAAPLSVEFTTEEREYLKRTFEKASKEEFTDDFWQVTRKIYDESL